jgi:hypothetical protein
MSCIYGEVILIARTKKQSFIPNAAPLPPTEKAPGQLVRRLNPLPVVGGWHLVVFAPRDRLAIELMLCYSLAIVDRFV